MKRRMVLIVLICTAALMIALAAAEVFASEYVPEVAHPDAQFEITDKDGNDIEIEYDFFHKTFINFPNIDDKVRVFDYSDPEDPLDEVFTYQGETSYQGYYFAGEDKAMVLNFRISATDYDNSTITLRLFRKINILSRDSPLMFDISEEIHVNSAASPIVRISFSPSQITLYAEDITEELYGGGTYYDLGDRSIHIGPDGRKWYSTFELGDRATAYFADGTKKEYVCVDALHNGKYTDCFIDENGEKNWIFTDIYKLQAGKNTVKCFFSTARDIQTTIEVYVKTSPKPTSGDGGDAGADNRYKISGNTYRIISESSKTAAFIKAKNNKTVSIPATIKLKGISYKVTTIDADAFKAKSVRSVTVGKNIKSIKEYAFRNSPATKIIIKSTGLSKSSVKGCLRKSKVKTVKVKAKSKYIKKYRKIFTRTNVGKKVSVV